MRRLLFGLTFFCGWAPLRDACAALSAPASPYELVRATLPALSAGPATPWFPETLEYEVKWGIFSVGWSNLKFSEIVDFAGEPAYHIVSEAKSNPFCDRFYKVRDLNESWIRARDLRSLGYSKKLREGEFFRDEWVLYDYERMSFVAKRTNKDGEVRLSSGTIPGAVEDILSSLYYLRPAQLKVGDEIVMDVNTQSNWPLVVKVLRKATVEVPAGTFKTVVVEPFLRKEGIFVQKGKKLEVFLTDDSRHIPVFMQVEVAFGHVAAYLTQIQSAAPDKSGAR